MDGSNLTREKRLAFEVIERNARAIALTGDNIFYFGELGNQEYESAALMAGVLETEGFAVQRGLSGFPTAFLATFGSGTPVIALHTEFDANPDNSQRAGVTEPTPIVDGAPGHCEGHNVNAAVMIGAAVALKRAMAECGIKGTLKVFGAPAEEQVLSRPYFVRDGYFDDVDVALHPHIGPELSVGYGLQQSALISATFTFHGETAHAGVAPWKGRDALDAVVLMDMGLAQYREHMAPTSRLHRAITEGGLQPNVVPKRAQIWWYFRDPTAEGAEKLFEHAKKVAEGAALMTNCTWEHRVLSAVWPTRGNRTVADTVHRNMEVVGHPQWSADEHVLARTLQERAGVTVEGLRDRLPAYKGEARQRPSANDGGDVSWKVPMVKFYFPANIPNIGFHHWAAGVALATSIAHKGAVTGAKVLAGAALDFLTDPALVTAAKASFAEELGGVSYRPLLPVGQEPPKDLNRDKMEPFRERMREHYIAEKPEFV
jgi:aminobenzoyl-glutamate utilization protein B